MNLLFFLILFVGQQSSSVLGIIETKTLQLDLRNELDMMTKDLVTRGLIEDSADVYHSYAFRSGIGNREELIVTSFSRNDGFFVGHDVEEWQSITSGGKIFMLGRSVKGINLTIADQKSSSNKSLKMTSQAIKLPPNTVTTASSMFERWNPSTKDMEMILVVALNSSTSDLLWYNIHNNTLEKFWSWPRYKPVSSMLVFMVGKYLYLIIVNPAEANHSTTADLYNIYFNKQQHDFRLFQSLPLSESSSSVEVGIIGKDTYLFIPQTRSGTLLVFKYVCMSGDGSHGYFQPNINISSPRVTRSHFFTTASQSFLAVNGQSPSIYRIKYSGGFENCLDSNLNDVEDWLIIPVHTYRSEVVILAKHKEGVKLLVWKGVGKGFSEGRPLTCDLSPGNASSCLNGRFSGAVAVPFYHSPSILLPVSSNNSVLYHLITSLHEIKDPVSFEMFHLHERRIFIQDIWNKQKKTGQEMRDSLSHVIKANSVNVITSKWIIESIETPALIQTGKVNTRRTFSNSIPASQDMDLTSMEEKISNIITEMKRLKAVVEEAELSYWNLKNFSGKVDVKGTVSILELTLEKLNGNDVNKMLNDTLRWDKPKKISGKKVVPNVKTDSLTFRKVKDFNATQLNYTDELVILSGNITFLAKISVQDYVQLVQGGLVNGIDFSEEICQINKSCSATLKFENLTVQNSITADKVNDENLGINSSEDPNVWFKVFAGRNLTIGNINGKNWTDISKRVIYTDRDMEIPETTFIKGIVFSENNILLRNLIDLSMPEMYNPELREQEGEAESFDIKTLGGQFKVRQRIKKPFLEQSSSSSPSAAIRNQEMGTQSLKDTFIDAEVLFTNIEVLGKVSSSEALNSNSWADEMADIILMNETEAEISSTKNFSNTLDFMDDFQVKGLVSGVKLSEVLTTDTDQILHGIRTFHSNVTIGNMSLSGVWDGINVITLDKESVKLSIDQTLPSLQLIFEESSANIDVYKLTITHSLNNISINDVITAEKIKQGLEFSSLSVSNLTVLGDLTLKGKMCGWNLNELDEQRFSLTRDQIITGNFSFNALTITDLFGARQINGLNISRINMSLNKSDLSYSSSDTVISELFVDGSINTSEGIAGYDLQAIVKDAILLTGNTNIKAELVFEDLLTFEILEVRDDSVGGQNWTTFTQTVVYRDEPFVVIDGVKIFESGFLVKGDLEVEEINGRRIQSILTTSTEQNITGEVTILGDLVVDEDVILDTINKRNISKLASLCYLPEESGYIVCTGDVNFENEVHVKDLIVGNFINHINFTDHVSSAVYKNTSSTVRGSKIFIGNITTRDLIVTSMNGQEFNKFLDDIVLMEPDVEISQHITFVENVNILGTIKIDSNLEAPTVNSHNLQKWAVNAVYLDRNMTVSGSKLFKSASSNGNIKTNMFGELDMIGGGIILLKEDQVLTGTLKFENLTSLGNIPVGRKVNNARLYEIFENTLMIDWDQIIESEIIFTEDIVIKGNLTTIGDVNDRDLKKVVSLHTNQTLSGHYVFDCLTITNDVNTTTLVSGVNITDWRQRAVLVDTDQEISGTWSIEGDVNFTDPVNDLVSIGDINLMHLSEQIKINILDVELKMEEHLNLLCNDTNVLIHKARQQEMSLLYFENAQQIDVILESFKTHYFQAYGEHYLLISKRNCSCNFYKWNPKKLLFSLIYEEDFFYITHWVVVQHNRVIYALSLSEETSSCPYKAVDLWLLPNSIPKNIRQLKINAEDLTVIEDSQNIFYTIESLTVKQWYLEHNEIGMLKITPGQEWVINTTGKIRFTDPKADLGLTVSNGSFLTTLLPSKNLPDNWIHPVSKEIANNFNHSFLAVAFWEDSEIDRRSDFVKIYKYNGLLYDKLLTKQPSHLSWFSLQDTVWLAFIENSTTLQVYQYQGVLRGFQQILSVNLQSSGLTSISLPVEGKWNHHPYLVLSSRTSVQLIESKVLGDPFTGPDLSCYFDWVER